MLKHLLLIMSAAGLMACEELTKALEDKAEKDKEKVVVTTPAWVYPNFDGDFDREGTSWAYVVDCRIEVGKDQFYYYRVDVDTELEIEDGREGSALYAGYLEIIQLQNYPETYEAGRIMLLPVSLLIDEPTDGVRMAEVLATAETLTVLDNNYEGYFFEQVVIKGDELLTLQLTPGEGLNLSEFGLPGVDDDQFLECR